MKFIKKETNRLIIISILLFAANNIFAQDVFELNSDLVGQHPRILFTQDEADARAEYVKENMWSDWNTLMNHCTTIGYPRTDDIPGQRQWWYFSRLGIGTAMSRNPNLITKAKSWLATCYQEDWDGAIAAESSVGLDVAHKLAGFALLYDCMYNDLDSTERTNYEELLKTAMIKFRTRGYDLNDYWTNDYQNNHMHFRATASLYCAIVLYDKYPELQSEFDYVKTVWRRILYMSPHDGSNHEGLNYSNYGGQMLYPGIHALKHCTDMDPTTSEHYKNVGYYYLYHVTPGFSSGFGFGDAGNAAAASGPNYLFQIANYTQDPYIQHLAHELRDKYSGNFFLPQWPVLYKDANLEQKTFDDLPLQRYFDDLGIVICRDGWEPDATAVAFKCGPLGGHLLNETRGTEYSHFTDYVNVAHDDPDQGTFLLFSKGSFLTTGDGYEKSNKITTQHSTFIVDDQTQFGGGGAWCQPKKLSQYAWQKDYAAVNDRVVFSGDMKGVYSNMYKLTRTFVSHKAKYIVIYDDAESATSGRTFEWRLQTEGELTDSGDKTYNVTNGEANALAKILSPAEADWSVTTNKIGNILRARLTGQQTNKFMVLLWPNAENLDAIAENINTEDVQGVKVAIEGNNEYTLFQKTDNQEITLQNFEFNGNTLILVQDNDENLKTASLVNGNKLSSNSVNYFSSEDRINFGIEEKASDKSKILYSIGPSSATADNSDVAITLGGFTENETYFLIKEGEKTGEKLETNNAGETTVQLNLEKTSKYLVSTDSILGVPLSSLEIKLHKDDINVYPNPSSGKLNISLKNQFHGKLNLSVYTLGGKEVLNSSFKKVVNDFSCELDISNQLKGTYVVQLSLDKFSWTRKILLH